MSNNMPKSHFCIICNKTDNLKKVNQYYCDNGIIENYSNMLEKCFKMNIFSQSRDKGYEICEKCIRGLRYCCKFREKVKLLHKRLNASIILGDKADNLEIGNVTSLTHIKGGDTMNFKSPTNVKPNNMSPLQLQQTRLKNKLKVQLTKARKIEQVRRLKNQVTVKSNPTHVRNQSKQLLLNNEEVMDSVNTISSDDETSDQDPWGVTSAEMKRATGYQRELELSKAAPFAIPPLDNTALDCPKCDETFESHSSLSVHYNLHFLDNLCHICGKAYVAKNSLKEHIKLHEVKGKIHKCDLCDRAFSYSYNLKSHVRTFHNKESRFKCYMCKERFKNTVKRKQHMIDAHNYKSKSFPCTVCDKVFIGGSILRRHLSTVHFKRKSFQCTECYKTFYKKCELDDHMAKHRGVSRHHCEFCGKPMASKKSLTVHLKIHNNIKNYKCSVCDKAFVQTSARNSHMRIHLKEPQTFGS